MIGYREFDSGTKPRGEGGFVVLQRISAGCSTDTSLLLS